MRIADKTVFISGGAKRIGAALSTAFAGAGAKVIIHYNRSGNEAEALLRSLPGNGHRAVCADFADQAAAAAVFSGCGRIDILINNASIYRRTAFMEEDSDTANEQLQINFRTPLELMRQFFLQSGIAEGNIINFLDQAVASPAQNGSGSYLFSKKMLRDATLAAALQFAPAVRVNAIAPGPVMPPSEMADSTMEKSIRRVPLHRKVELNNIIDACFFLIANDAVTGQILYVDSGEHLL